MKTYEEIEIIEKFPSGKVKTTKIKRTVRTESVTDVPFVMPQNIKTRKRLPLEKLSLEQIMEINKELRSRAKRNKGVCKFDNDGIKCKVEDNKIIGYDEQGFKKFEINLDLETTEKNETKKKTAKKRPRKKKVDDNKG